jgi:hypothetical protein
MLKDGPSKAFLGAVCVCLAVALVSVSTSPYQAPQAPEIKTKPKPDNGLKSQEDGDKPEASLDRRGENNNDHGSDNASEFWTVLGRRVKITDTFLVLFTYFLWGATRDMVNSTEKTARQQLRAFVFGKGFNTHLNVDDMPPRPQAIREYIIIVTWENVGLTPATVVRGVVRFQTFPMNENHEPSFKVSGKLDRPFVLGPKGTGTSRMTTIPISTMWENWRRETEIFVWSYIEYRDIFNPDVLHHHQMCARVELHREPDIFPRTNEPLPISYTIYGPLNTTA